ncbi:hypothetical protein BT69DRAFT_654054 [Atractiella rhizophila]|nr:hypothetical protein BT69DRAFT_654054 [Atractiella rhizophila]
MRASLLWSSFLSIVAVSAQNLVQDPSFNIASSGGGWSIYGSSYARYYPGEGIDGSSCFGIASTSEQFDVASQPVSGLTVGGTYTLSFWLRYRSTAPTSVYVTVGDFFSGEVPSNQITGSWVQHTFTFTSTARTASLTIYGVNLPDWTYVDNVFLGLSGSSYNLVHDPGFEQSNPTSPWGLSGGSTAAIEAGSYDTSATIRPNRILCPFPRKSMGAVALHVLRPHLECSPKPSLALPCLMDGRHSPTRLDPQRTQLPFLSLPTAMATPSMWTTFRSRRTPS